MTVRFILGRAGSGKTTACLDSIANISHNEPVGPPLIFLVPEQATFQVERELAIRCGGGTFRAQALSFQRLAHRLLQAQGGLPPVMTELGRQMTLRRMLQGNAHRLETFTRPARQPRFAQQLAIQIRELKNYCVAPQTLRNMATADGCPEGLRGKLADLAVIYEEYTAFTNGRFTDPEDTLALMAALLEIGALPPGTRVWVDGFAGFTEQEFQCIGALLKCTEHLEIALCLDPREIPAKPVEDHLFGPTLETYRRLRILCGEAATPVLPALHLPQNKQATRFMDQPELAHLEKNFERFPVAAYNGETASVKLVHAAGTRAEVEAVARDILHRVRENGWRYREIGIILRDFSGYHDIVAAVFADYNIPCFIDNRQSAAHHPLLELIRSALEAAQNNLQSQTVFQMLKTDFFPLERTAADRLENYARAHGIRGSRWLDGKAWTYRLHLSLDNELTPPLAEGNGLPEVNAAKDSFASCYGPFHKAVSRGGKKSAQFFCHALWDLLQSVDVKKTLQNWADADEARGETTKAGEHRQVWQGILEILDQIAEILGDQQLSLQDFYQVVLSGLEAMSLGLVPAGLDQVLVGNVERSRQPNLRAAYVLGMSEGDFPARLAQEGLFGDEERDALTFAGVEMAASRRQKLFHEQYLAYIALTRSSDYLWVSSPLADEEGKAKRPSSLFGRLREMFADVNITFFGNTTEDGEGLHFLAGANNMAAVLLLQAGRRKDAGSLPAFWAAVYDEALNIPELSGRMKLLWPALTHSNAVSPLSAERVATLFGTPLRGSVSRLELFARCPFAHFSRYGLGLEERLEFRVEAPDMGTFFHAALRVFVEELLKEGITWATLEAAVARERMEAVVDRLVPLLHGEILLSTARMRYLADTLKKTLADAVDALTEHAHRGSFAPAAVELSFGRGDVPPWRLPAGEGSELRLRGQIDRVDVAEEEDRAYFRVIDYKSNPQELQLADVWHGLSLQLPAYLAVARENIRLFTDKEAVCAGAFYFGLQHPFVRVDNPDDGLDTGKKRLRLDGILLEDTDAYRLMGGAPDLVRATLKKDGTFAKSSRVATEDELSALMAAVGDKLSSLAGEILEGRADAHPYKKPNGQRACTFCAYMPVCRFDLSVAGNAYRNLSSIGHKQVLQEALRQKGGNACGH
jgi:ATP-dependent helicase/nuclease subunit B